MTAKHVCPNCEIHEVDQAGRWCLKCFTSHALAYMKDHPPVLVNGDSLRHSLLDQQHALTGALDTTVRKMQQTIDDLHDELYAAQLETDQARQEREYDRALARGLQDQVDGLREVIRTSSKARESLQVEIETLHTVLLRERSEHNQEIQSFLTITGEQKKVITYLEEEVTRLRKLTNSRDHLSHMIARESIDAHANGGILDRIRRLLHV